LNALGVKIFSDKDIRAVYKKLSKHHYQINDKYKIPYITHYIWSTDPANPKEIKLRDIKRIKKTLSLLKQDNSKYVHYMWVNQKGLIPKSIKGLKGFNIIVKEVKELDRFKELQNEITFLNNFNVGAYSDFIRLLVLEEYGGIYMDVDVWLKNKPNFIDIHKYASVLFTYDMDGYGGKYYADRNFVDLDLFVPFNILFDDTDFKQSAEGYYININSRKMMFSKIGTCGASGSWEPNQDLAITNWQRIVNFVKLNIVRIQKFIYLIKKNKLFDHICHKI